MSRIFEVESAGAIYGADGDPQFFADPGMDRFVAVIFNLAAEVWAQEERLLTLEAAARPAAIPIDREALSKAFIHRVFGALREPEPLAS